MRPVAAPQNPFPERRGYAKNEWDIMEVMNIDRYTPSYRSWLAVCQSCLALCPIRVGLAQPETL